MRKWINILVMAVFVLTTTMPVASHAHNYSKVMSHAYATEDHDHAVAKIDHHEHDNKKPCCDKHAGKDKNSCCDKGMCKCVTNACNGGLAKIIANSDQFHFAISPVKSRISFVNEFVHSAPSERLKRPPRA